MKKLTAIIRYECTTSFKYIWIFYAILLGVVLLLSVITGIGSGHFVKTSTNCLELNTLIYVGVLGVMGFQEDFKMLLQNGFTRKYIFIASLIMFAFISGTMALVDTVLAHLLHNFTENYSSLYGNLYGYGNYVMNWLWLTLLYTATCTLLYLGVLLINRYGKRFCICLYALLGSLFLIIIALFRFVFSQEIVHNTLQVITKAAGFMADGTINYMNPLLTLCSIVILLSAISFLVIRRTELR